MQLIVTINATTRTLQDPRGSLNTSLETTADMETPVLTLSHPEQTVPAGRVQRGTQGSIILNKKQLQYYHIIMAL